MILKHFGVEISVLRCLSRSWIGNLDDELLDTIPNFDILAFWKMHTGQYPIFGELAKDILAIHVSTVASESAS